MLTFLYLPGSTHSVPGTFFEVFMNKLIGLGLGLAVGLAIGVIVSMLVAPSSGDELKRNLRRGYDETLDEARRASEQRRLELEAELKRRRGHGLTLP